MTFSDAMTMLPLVRRSGLSSSRQGASDRPAGRGANRAPNRAVDPRHATFRQMSELSLELYLAGDLGFPESAYFGRQPELQPAYRRTVGRLTGIDADADLSHNHLQLWEDRLAFAERYFHDNRPQLDRLRRIVGALRRLVARIDTSHRAHRRLAG